MQIFFGLALLSVMWFTFGFSVSFGEDNAGLAGITPASGYVSVKHSFIIGIAIGLASYYRVVLFKDKLKIDDALDVSSVHGVAGIIGALATGIFEVP